MVAYDLTHLTQDADQQVSGPIQDDEALLIYALIKVMRLRRVLEIGGLSGYSARNFIAAVGNEGVVYTVDLQEVPAQAPNHRIITKDAADLTAADIDSLPLDLVFFDCHFLKVQMELLFRLTALSLITSDTVLILHDTNLHPAKFVYWSKEVEGGWEHQRVERQMVDDLRRLGYDAVCFHTDMLCHGPELPFRHGLTIMRKYRRLGMSGALEILRHHTAILAAKYGLRPLSKW